MQRFKRIVKRKIANGISHKLGACVRGARFSEKKKKNKIIDLNA